ncbi:DNA (cytosine-5-)-methyltransferase [Streptomyces sp. NPDC006678]|uniref:DNA cytosine methyltransferase n=1 Tax=Streptomyces sp. NPDC006678 TaxID=3157185 RepID=UPI0033C0F492
MARTNELKYSSVEICAGAGGQAVGLHDAGFKHVALVEIDKDACATLEANVASHEEWNGCRVLKEDLNDFDPASLGLRLNERVDLAHEHDTLPGQNEQAQAGLPRLDLLAGGVPCPPFSAAGKQLGEADERDLFPVMLSLVRSLDPRAVMIENVRGLMDPKFEDYRKRILSELEAMGYVKCLWEVLEAKDYGVPQLRPRSILVAMKSQYEPYFSFQAPEEPLLKTVGAVLHDSMKHRFDAVDDPRAEEAFKRWHEKAQTDVAPTLVGGSKKHGGADLGPTRAKKAWRDLGVCAMGVANEPEKMADPGRDLFADAGPKLTVKQAALIQGFPESWPIGGRKTAAYRQVGNAFPPPVAQAVGERIYQAFEDAAKAGVI